MGYFFKVSKKRRRGLHRRKRQTWWQHKKELLWPSMGLWAWLRNTEIQVKRQKEAQHKVALGLALGVAVGMLPTLGQVFIGVAVAWLFGGSMVIAALATFVGNPWTFPLIWSWDHRVGNWLLGTKNHPPLPEPDKLLEIIKNFGEVFWQIWYPTFVGSIPTAIVVGAITYGVTRINLAAYHEARSKLLKSKRAEHKMRWLPHRHQEEE